MQYLLIGQIIKKGDEVDIQPFSGGPFKPIWKKVSFCMIGQKVTEGTYGKYRRFSTPHLKEE